MFLSCVAVRRSNESTAPITLRMVIPPNETLTITTGTSEVLCVKDSISNEISVFQGAEKLGKLFIDLNEFEFSRPIAGMFVFDKAVMRLRRPGQLLSLRELNALHKTTIVLTLVIMRLSGDSRRDSVRGFCDFAENASNRVRPSAQPARKPLGTQPPIMAELPSVGNAAATTPTKSSADNENADPANWRQLLERRLAEKDAEIEHLRREISRLRLRVEAGLAAHQQSPLK
jgi:hypothetical protein